MEQGALTNLIVEYRYLILVPLTILQGPTAMTVGGFFLRLGYFTFWPLYLVLMITELFADAIWYAIGYHGAHSFVRKYGRFFGITEKLVERTKAAFHRHHDKILFLSKITMGFGFALVVLMTAGLTRVPFKRYILFNAAGQFIWTAFLIGIGYAFGNLYLVIDEGLRLMSLFAFVIIILLLGYGFSRYLRTRDLENTL